MTPIFVPNFDNLKPKVGRYFFLHKVCVGEFFLLQSYWKLYFMDTKIILKGYILMIFIVMVIKKIPEFHQ